MGILEKTLVNEFEWDSGNLSKNWEKHLVHYTECEEVFQNIPLILFEDNQHSLKETRFYLLGKTDNNRKLFIVFTIRGSKIRIISARDMNKKERKIYEFEEKNTKVQF